jgi:hypothetical protein
VNHKEALLNACNGYRAYNRIHPGTLMLTDVRFEHGARISLVRPMDALDLVLVISVQQDAIVGDIVAALDPVRGHVTAEIMPGHYRQRAFRVKATCDQANV